jgi:hypothetical protein
MSPNQPATILRRRPAAWSLALVCWFVGGCHGVHDHHWNLLKQPYVCPGCQAWSPETCHCGPSLAASGYHETNWRTLDAGGVVIAGHVSDTELFSSHDSVAGTDEGSDDWWPGPEPIPPAGLGDASSSGGATSTAGGEGSAAAISEESIADDESSRYFFELDDEPVPASGGR